MSSLMQRSAIRSLVPSLAIVALGGLLLSAARADTATTQAHAPAFKGDWHLLQSYCEKCHNSEDWAGGVAFDTMNAAAAGDDAKIWEEAVMKLRGGLMPPPGKPQPDPAARAAFVHAAEEFLDQYGAAHPDP